METRLLLLCSLAVLCIRLTSSQIPEKLSGNLCLSKETCGQCITAAASCGWCSQDGFSFDGSHRCDLISNLKDKCQKNKLTNPKTLSNKEIDKDLGDKGQAEHAVQIKPQKINLKMRPNDPHNLKVEFRQAEDYSVDLYYLMDLSLSMKDDKDKLALLGDLLAEKMGNITSNFRLGFGSFVDKVVMPYVSTAPEKLLEPCKGCAPPYGFFNQLPLSLDTNRFSKEVSAARVSGNWDAPEGGFDAIMQAIVCQKEINWGERSRKLLLFSSDSSFHYAGDGKLGGIVKPNDGLCHLDTKGYYTESVHQDYPSLSQLNQKISEHNMNIIFAVTSEQLGVYERLSDQLEGSSTGKLETDSSNIVELVRDQYQKYTSEVELKDDASSNIEVTYYSTCLDGKKEKRSLCKGLKVGTTVSFEAHIEVLSCPKDRSNWNQTFKIYPVGLNESLVVKLEIICECDCEKPWNQEIKSDKCSKGNGTYECGVCSCYQNRYGRTCECDSQDTDQAKDGSACYNKNETIMCSNRGRCRCGVCDCDPPTTPNGKIWGGFCECDNYSCDRHDGKICNGEYGECDCGVCACKKGWKGRACECRDTNDTCIAPNGKICSGHGSCECGQCKCVETEDEGYSGPFCEFCHTCPGKCDEYKDCVQCFMYETGALSKEECSKCSFIPIKAKEVEVEDESEKLCIFRDESDDCKFTFKYKFDKEDHLLITAQITKDCPEDIDILAIILGVVGGIVAIGLALLLVWKLLTTIHDRREVAKFRKEVQNVKWNTAGNALYKPAISEFQNPTFGKN